jgi:hypothetical protein
MVAYVQRGRDVAHLIQQDGEAGLRKAVIRLAEDNEMLRQELASVVLTVNKMADIVADIATVGARLKEEWAHKQRAFHPDNEANPDQKWSKK